ncbi:hypothetical protein WOLCODRAFT_144977 [Wolfiporia cocos MD-104 SS10]|uniref:RED-like N-terminal domain-containing protein n=1 Tax=Wolfiporia cocos (strain MD-104) TaxID=742152 RepID=A0A2H3K7M7_WOLCO|nr:hypothetical protein WOLCODRAFT_144977 [Wolfiporia cocos MD-104 SS10]
MDQDSFRKLLQTPKAGSSSASTSRGSLLTATASKSKQKTTDASQPAFKPRTVKKKAQGTQQYRDRATERRLGLDNDYAQVEALAADFERRNADNADRKAVEEQRRYLGGDSDHTVLVKGLDHALLEQNRARVAASTTAEDDATLEQAFLEASSSIPRKRTREEIIQELKSKRAKGGDGVEGEAEEKKSAVNADLALEEAKKAGKFRPIGFKPIGSEQGEKTKKKKLKQKVDGKGFNTEKKKPNSGTEAGGKPTDISPVPAPLDEAGPSSLTPPTKPEPQPKPDPEPIDDNFDIFADAGEYTGVDLGDDDNSDGDVDMDASPRKEEPEEQALPVKGRWFAIEEEDAPKATSPQPLPAAAAEPRNEKSHSPVAPSAVHSDQEDEEEERPMRLQPLASSALPSIRELLELDSAAGKAGKRRSRKEKKKDKRGDGDGKVDKDKIDRDYKQLKAYTDKKAAAEGS